MNKVLKVMLLSKMMELRDWWVLGLTKLLMSGDKCLMLLTKVQSLENVIIDTVNEVWNEVWDELKPMP